MNTVITSRWLVGVALLLTLTACGGSNVKNGSSTIMVSAAQTTSGTAAGAIPPAPSAAQLNTQIKGVLDRGLPDDARLALIEDGEVFRTNVPDLYKAMDENPKATYTVVDPVIDNGDGTLTATFSLDKDGTGASVRNASVQFIAVGGQWRVKKDDVCAILQMADYNTPACV